MLCFKCHTNYLYKKDNMYKCRYCNELLSEEEYILKCQNDCEKRVLGKSDHVKKALKLCHKSFRAQRD